jgi:hypothetical protein
MAALQGVEFQILYVPGHSRDTCISSGRRRIYFRRRCLFAGALGRWDLPGGDRDLLFSGIREKNIPAWEMR